MVLVGIAPPDREAHVAEIRVEAIDGGDVDGLELARVPAHRIERDAAIDPAGRVTGKEVIGKRRQDKILRPQRFGEKAGAFDR